MPDIDYLTKITDVRTGWSNLIQRWKDDADLTKLLAYTMKDLEGKKIPNIVHVTLDRPRMISENIKAFMGSDKEQVVVESSDKGFDTDYVEDFQKAIFSMANERLRNQDIWQLDPFADEQFCLRGRAVRRIMCQMVNGKFVPDITSWDAAYVTYEKNANGLMWGGYQTKLRKDDILAESWTIMPPFSVEKPFTMLAKEAEYTEVWDKDKMYIWVGSTPVFEMKNKWGYPPLVIEIVSLGTMLADENMMQFQGESIFFLIRNTIKELQSLASILQTHNLKSIKGPVQEKTKDGEVTGEYEERTGMGQISPAEIGGGIDPIQFEVPLQSMNIAFPWFEKAIQEGGVTSLDIGNEMSPHSAVAIESLAQARNQVLDPRRKSKADFNSDTMTMVTRQVIQIDHDIKVGSLGHERTFNVNKLKGEYSVEYRYYEKSPILDVARQTLSNAAEKWLDYRTILTDVQQAENPDEIMRRKLYDKAAEISPTVRLFRTIVALGEMEEEGYEWAGIEALAMANEANMTIDQIKQGVVPEMFGQNGGGKPSDANLLKTFQGGRSTSNKRASELMGTPQGGV
ncbi:hypothetical protein LCGC14_0370260 [marine sediment metagenome]|uniref:Portal protein n=1 Tax=marine sediment metagenome TaxID=412755 RepID=A0A0F9TNM6_9ZZZZ